jgi:hypothetical protein
MKFGLLTASLLALSTAAHAQMVFDGADITVDSVIPLSGGFGDATKIGVSGRFAVSFGNIGIQSDIGYDTGIGGGFPPGFYSWDAGLHTYYKINDRVKVGAFYASETLDIFIGQYSTFGAEAMIAFGKLDVEIAIGGMDALGGDDIFIISADGYYQINDSFEVNAGVWSFSGAGDTITNASIGASYALANVPVSLGATYTHGFISGGGPGADSISVNVSYSFGGNGNERLFKTRNLDYLDFIFTFGGL